MHATKAPNLWINSTQQQLKLANNVLKICSAFFSAFFSVYDFIKKNQKSDNCFATKHAMLLTFENEWDKDENGTLAEFCEMPAIDVVHNKFLCNFSVVNLKIATTKKKTYEKLYLHNNAIEHQMHQVCVCMNIDEMCWNTKTVFMTSESFALLLVDHKNDKTHFFPTKCQPIFYHCQYQFQSNSPVDNFQARCFISVLWKKS